MSEEIAFYLEAAKEGMTEAYKHLEHELTKIRAGKVSPDMLSDVRVEYYGASTPLNQLATIKSLDARTLVITPFEKGLLGEVEKGIFAANIGLTPQNDGELIRIVMPPTTEDRRRDLVKAAKYFGEEAKISIRNSRKDAIHHIKESGASEDMISNGEIDVQALTDKFTEKVDKLIDAKEKEIMTV